MTIEFYDIRTANNYFKHALYSRVSVADIVNSLWFGPMFGYDPVSRSSSSIVDITFNKANEHILSKMSCFALISDRKYFAFELILKLAYKVRHNFFVSMLVILGASGLCILSANYVYKHMRTKSHTLFDGMDKDTRAKISTFCVTGKLKEAEHLILHEPTVQQSLREHIRASTKDKIRLVSEIDSINSNLEKIIHLINLYNKQNKSGISIGPNITEIIKFIDKHIVHVDKHTSKILYAAIRSGVLTFPAEICSSSIPRTVQPVHKFDFEFRRFQHLAR